jgi:hypothetical protein
LPDLGTFRGQYTEDVNPGEDAWQWRFAAGQVAFSTKPDTALDASTAIGYCGLCEQDMREARGLDPDTKIYVRLIHN